MTTEGYNATVAEITKGLIECAIWTDLNYGDDPEGKHGSGNRESDDPREVSDVDAGDAALLNEICGDFLQANPDDCDLYLNACLDGVREGFDPSKGTPGSYLGHDVWLTACGHGTGFWDRGLDDLGERLTRACKSDLSFLEYIYVSTQPSVEDKPTPPVYFDGLPKAA